MSSERSPELREVAVFSSDSVQIFVAHPIEILALGGFRQVTGEGNQAGNETDSAGDGVVPHASILLRELAKRVCRDAVHRAAADKRSP